MNVQKRRGRPPKKKSINLHCLSEFNVNNNKNNIWPVSKIETNYTLTKPHPNKDYKVLCQCDKPQIFATLFEVLKGRYGETEMSFTKSGIIMKYLKSDVQNDMARLIVKIFPDKLLDYRIRENVSVRINIASIFKIFKTIPKSTIFIMIIRNVNDTLHLEICYRHYGQLKRFNMSLRSLIYINTYEYINDLSDYPVIAILESSAFTKDCKDIKMFSNVVVIDYSTGKNNIGSLSFIYSDTNMSNNITMSPFTDADDQNPHFFFIKKPEFSVSGKYIISAINKYIKCDKFSTITKLYISNENPLIIEYDIEPYIGTIQIFVSTQLT